MRYVSIDNLAEGMQLGRGIFDATGQMLLKQDTQLTTEHISYIRRLGMQGVYIEDAISHDIKLDEVVSQEVKSQVAGVISHFFTKPMEGTRVSDEEIEVQEAVEQVVDEILADEMVMYNMVDIKNYNDYVYLHSLNTGIMSAILGVKMKLTKAMLADLVTAAFLHDIGKAILKPELMRGGRPFTIADIEDMKKHVDVGYAYLKEKTNFRDLVCESVYQHHEWFNGRGYPNHLRGSQTHLTSRILRIADTFDNMTSALPGRRAYPPAEVMEYIMSRTGTEFDPQVVAVMVESFCIYPVGSEVVLSDGRHAIVVENHAGFMQRPTIRLFDGIELNLRSERDSYNVTIKNLVV